jgi:hypothetical protein
MTRAGSALSGSRTPFLFSAGDSIAARGTGAFTDIACDTVVFAIGDRVDEDLGIPCSGTEYVRNPNPDPANPGDEAYQVYDPEQGRSLSMASSSSAGHAPPLTASSARPSSTVSAGWPSSTATCRTALRDRLDLLAGKIDRFRQLSPNGVLRQSTTLMSSRLEAS